MSGVAPTALTPLAPGLHRWTARHPDWHPGHWGAEVACFAHTTADGDLLLVDPLLPADEPDLLDDLARAATNTYILITIPYHVRSSEQLSERYRASIHGPPQAAGRFTKTTNFHPLEPGAPGPGGAQAFAIGKPRRHERPIWLPSCRAIAFGDALVSTPENELRMWIQHEPTPKRIAWYRDAFAPTLDALRALPATRVLTTHGEPILVDGAAALGAALDQDPWYHRG